MVGAGRRAPPLPPPTTGLLGTDTGRDTVPVEVEPLSMGAKKSKRGGGPERIAKNFAPRREVRCLLRSGLWPGLAGETRGWGRAGRNLTRPAVWQML